VVASCRARGTASRPALGVASVAESDNTSAALRNAVKVPHFDPENMVVSSKVSDLPNSPTTGREAANH